MEQHDQATIMGQIIRSIDIYYYSSRSSIFHNTALIEICEYFPENIKVTKIQCSEPSHQTHGEFPICLVNGTELVKKHNIWDFLALAIGVNQLLKFEFLAVANLSEELADVISLFSDYDQNPYFVFISPWRKYKRHCQLEGKKKYICEQKNYIQSDQNHLKLDYFVKELQNLFFLLKQYSTEGRTPEHVLICEKILIFSMLKQIKAGNEEMNKVSMFTGPFKEMEQQVMGQILAKQNRKQPINPVSFSNVSIPYLNAQTNEEGEKKDEQYQLNSEREKLLQKLFKPLLATAVFWLVFSK